MKTLKKLPFLLVFVFTLFVAGCSDDTIIEPVNTEDDGGPIIIPPPGTK